MNSTNQTNKFTRFLRNNAALLLLIFCAVAISAVVIAVSVTGNEPDAPVGGTPDDSVVTPPIVDEKPTPTVITEKVYFTSPVAYKSVGMDYTDDQLLFVYNPTLNQWLTHKGIDLLAAENSPVTAMYDGTVLEVGESYGMGHYVKVDHGENVVATYASLTDVQVVAGQNVAKGDKLGVVSTTASYEFSDGAHLHLEVAQNGKQVDPTNYVEGKIYREITKIVTE